MMKQILCCATLILSLSLFSCTSEHFLKETDYRAKVETDFQAKKDILNQGNLFAVFDSQLTTPEREALMFLYAYMTPGDIADYSGEFYLNNVRQSLQLRKESSWGKTIPDLIFRHFVLPIRVNNENLDNAREVFSKELWPRVKDLSMLDAVLEVNHWCHEKVVYQPTDIRTSAPMATVKTAYGRCGEESTFLVAALRSVGIPARQVYTPRWAHTDDNHAWVEAWVDGQWHFLGACEPEPVLDLGWFNAPASRGMLMHTKVFGVYDGPEDVMQQTANFTEINIIDNYATSAKVDVTVVDKDQQPVSSANVEFKVYNYAEYFTVAKRTCDEGGHTSLSAGLGDMLIFASANGQYGIQKVSFGKDKNVVVVMDKTEGTPVDMTVDIVPPAENAKIPTVTPEQRQANSARMAHEDSIRHAYEATFPTEASLQAFADSFKDKSAAVIAFLIKSRGNHQDIQTFLQNAQAKNMGERALALLGTLSDKDLRDTPCSVLEDHLYQTSDTASVTEVLAPRIENELLTPYRSYLKQAIPADLQAKFKQNPQELVNWCKDSLVIRNDLNTLSTVTSPAGVWKSRITDTKSREIFFVAAARSLEIAAWKDAVTGNIYYRAGQEKPVHVDFDNATVGHTAEGTLKMNYKPITRLSNPKYYVHFSISKFNNGTFQLLNYPEDATWESLFKEGTNMEAGHYLLVTGSRMADGGVLSNVTCFTVEEGKTTTIDLVMRDNAEEIRVIGNVNSEAKFHLLDGTETTILNTAGRGYFIVGILGVGEEPTNHALKDIQLKKEDFEKWGRGMILLFTSEEAYKKFDKKNFPNLPSNITFGIDTDGSMRKMIAENMKLTHGGQLPVFIIGDTFNRVVFESHGYTIGLGEQMIHVIKGL